MMFTRVRLYLILAAGIGVFIGLVLLHERDAVPLEQPADHQLSKRARTAYFQRMLRDPETGEIPTGIRKRELAHAATMPKWGAIGGKAARATNIMWIEAGPTNVGGRTRALAVDRTNSNTVLAGGVAGGIWKSTDRGNSWELKSDPTLLNSVTYITQDPREGHTTTWYAVTGEREQSNWDRGKKAAPFGEGFFTSTDNGESWTRIQSSENPTLFDSPFDFGLKVLVSPTTGSIFIASQAFGIQRLQSPTAEPEWLLGTESLPEWADFDIASDGSIIAVTSFGFTPTASETPGVFYSVDDGNTWQDITPAAYPGAPERSVVAFAPSDPSRAYLWTYTGEVMQAINAFGFVEVMQFHAFSLPSGTSENRTAFLPPDFNKNLGDLYTQNSYNMAIAVNPNDPDDVFIGGTNLYRSKNGFSLPLDEQNDIARTWVGGYALKDTGEEYEDHHPDQHALFFDPNEEGVLWSGHDGGLSMAVDIDSTTNLIDWKDKNNGYNVTQFYHVSLTPGAGDERIIGGTQDNGTHFIRFDPSALAGTPSQRRITGADGGYTYLGEEYGISSLQEGVLIQLRYGSTSGNILLAEQDPISPEAASNQLFINPFAVDRADDSYLYYPAGRELWLTDNLPGPVRWSRLQNVAIPPAYVISSLVTGVREINQVATSVLYFAASGNNLAPLIYRLDNASSTTEAPVNISIPDLPADSYIHHMATNPMDGNELLVLASNYNIVGLYHSLDGGTTFNPVEGNLTGTSELPGPSLRAATILPVNGTTLYIIGTSTGVYSTTFLNGQDTEWIQEGVPEIGNTIVESVVSRTSDQYIALGTHGRGIFIGMPVPTVSTDELPEAPLSAEVDLNQNYPNPFNATTTLPYTLKKPGIVSLSLFDLTGRRVRTLLKQKQHVAGTFSFPFDSGTLSSGTYIYQLEVRPLHSSDEVIRESRVMVLQK